MPLSCHTEATKVLPCMWPNQKFSAWLRLKSKLSQEWTVTLGSEQSAMMAPFHMSKAWMVCPPVHTVLTASFSTEWLCYLGEILWLSVIWCSYALAFGLPFLFIVSVSCQLLTLECRISVSGSEVSSSHLSLPKTQLSWCHVPPPLLHLLVYCMLPYTMPYIGKCWSFAIMNLDSCHKDWDWSSVSPLRTYLSYWYTIIHLSVK